jgi:hypothetical protein
MDGGGRVDRAGWYNNGAVWEFVFMVDQVRRATIRVV